MKTSELVLSVLDITEDEYSYKAQFILSAPGKSKFCEMDDLESAGAIAEIKNFFCLEESPEDIGKILMDMIMQRANIGSKIAEGENF